MNGYSPVAFRIFVFSVSFSLLSSTCFALSVSAPVQFVSLNFLAILLQRVCCCWQNKHYLKKYYIVTNLNNKTCKYSQLTYHQYFNLN